MERLNAIDVVARLRTGYQLLRASRHADAVALAEKACAAVPTDARLCELAAEARLANGEPLPALRWIEAAVTVSATPLPLLLKQADLLLTLRLRDDAGTVLERASALAGHDGRMWWRIGTLRGARHDVAGAAAALQRARELLGDQSSLLYELATMQFFGGHYEAAELVLDRLLEIEPDSGDACYLRATLRRQTAARNHITPLRGLMAKGLGSAAADAACGYALAKELEDLGEHDEAFSVLARSASRKRSSLRYDVQGECAAIEAIAETFTGDALQAMSRGDGGEGALFIVGMPRTGTTLLERLLVERAGARPAGELADFAALLGHAAGQQRRHDPALTPVQAASRVDFAALGNEYMRGAREAAGGAARFIDKMPINFLYCGMIAAALPKARIIHLVRDPLDTCYAVFKTLFYNAYPFSYDLDELGRYYLAYRRLMQHWHAVMPGRIVDVRYEDLVASPDATMQQVLEACRIEALERVDLADVAFVTASAGQVRGAIHQRSVGSALRHLRHLVPLVEQLRAADVVI